MQLNCSAVWDECLHVIKEQIGDQSFKTWFAPIKPLKLESNVLTIQVPSQFFYEWLEEHYVHIIKQALDQNSGQKEDWNILSSSTKVMNKTVPIPLTFLPIRGTQRHREIMLITIFIKVHLISGPLIG